MNDIPQEVLEFCTEHKLTTDQFYGKTKYSRNLHPNSVTTLIPGFNPQVECSLYLNSVTTLVPGFNPTVGGGLHLNSVATLVPEFNPFVGGGLYLDSVTTLVPGFNPQVGGCHLRSPQLASLGDISTVGGSLSLVGCSSLRSLGSNLKSVRYLDLERTPVYVIPEDLVIGEGVWLDGPDRYIPAAEARWVLKEFKDSIKCANDAGEVLLDRLNRPLWQVAYATDYLNGDLQV